MVAYYLFMPVFFTTNIWPEAVETHLSN